MLHQICQQTKYYTHKKLGVLLQPFPLTSIVWGYVFMDFSIGLPQSQVFNVLLMVVDLFPKGIHLDPLPTCFTAYKVGELLMTMVCKHHELPKSIVSDKDHIFISQFWYDLFHFSGTLLRMSSSYYPQTDGQT